MSDALQVFIQDNDVPKLNDIIESLISRGLFLEKWDVGGIDSLRDIDGFWPGSFNGSKVGFEFSMGEVDEEDLDAWKVRRGQLEGRDMMMELCYYTEQDLIASVLFIQLICGCYRGLTFDENDELTINAKNSEDWKNSVLKGLLNNT